jgi:hypothetical protein
MFQPCLTRVLTMQIILNSLQGLRIDYPKLSEEKQQELRSIRARLAK